ncbi:ribonuclease H-like domain-containing protein, partial [Tanacetum coccineum]
RINSSPSGEGSKSSQVGSPTIDHGENEGMHSLGSNGSATENEMAATLEDNINISEGENENVQSPDVVQINQPLRRNDTWEITELPKGRKSIGGKWVFKIKYKSNGEIERYKARYVIKSYNQKKGIDFDETFSPVVKIVTIRCLITLVVQNDWPMYQLDVNNAFLYSELSKTVYMDLPEGFFNHGDKRVCRLKKSLYRLKQAPRQ